MILNTEVVPAMDNPQPILSPTFDFLWKNGTLHQKVLVTDVGAEEPIRTDWTPVLVGCQPVRGQKQQTFKDRNGTAPEDALAMVRRDAHFSRHVIEFDGGTSCNSPKKGFGNGYGSYQIDGGEIVRVEFGKGHSNNSAEIRTLVAALKALADIPCDLPRIALARGDSQIALKWVKCGAVPKDKTSEGFREAIELLREQVRRFHNVKTEWRRRTHSVALFGH
jgi:ribonuclease HI